MTDVVKLNRSESDGSELIGRGEVVNGRESNGEGVDWTGRNVVKSMGRGKW